MRANGVVVLYTGAEPTLAALRTARRLTREDGAPVRLVMAVAVPYPLPAASPPVRREFAEGQCRRVAEQSALAARIEVYLCRDRRDMLRERLEPGCVVVVGTGRRGWWGGPERGLVRWLQREGHSVVLAAPDKEAGKDTSSRNVVPFRMPNSSH